VQWVGSDHPISSGLPPTFVANDELYNKIDLKPNAHVIATAYDDPTIKGGTGKQEPAIWTVPFGTGRVVMIVLGHDLLAMSQPGFMDALARANQIRIKRAQLKRDLKAGRLSIHALLLSPPEYVETANVFDMLLAVPKYGRVKVNKILAHCRIAPSKTIGGLSERQRSELISLLTR